MIDALSEIEDLGEGHTWFKLVFDITGTQHTEHALILRAIAESPVGEVGFEAQIPLHGWKEQELRGDIHVDWGKVALRSIGRSTDSLLKLLEQQFQLPESGAVVAPELVCTAVLLADDPDQLESAEMHTKLFFDSLANEDPSSYGELYFNFDVPARKAYLMEKDEEYRAPIVGWLSGHFRQSNEKVH